MFVNGLLPVINEAWNIVGALMSDSRGLVQCRVVRAPTYVKGAVWVQSNLHLIVLDRVEEQILIFVSCVRV